MIVELLTCWRYHGVQPPTLIAKDVAIDGSFQMAVVGRSPLTADKIVAHALIAHDLILRFTGLSVYTL